MHQQDMRLRLTSMVTFFVLLLSSGQACDAPPRFRLMVAEPPSNVCLNTVGSNILSAVFSYIYSTLQGEPNWESELDGKRDCTITPGDRTMKGNEIGGNITVTCPKSGSQLSTGAHTIVLKAGYEGLFPCAGGIAVETATVVVDPKPTISLRASNVELCPGTSSFTVLVTNADITFVGALQAAAFLNGNIPCTAVAGPPGATGRSGPITVTCSTGGNEPFPEGQHTLTVQASAEDATLTGCASPTPATATAVVTVLAAPEVRLIRPRTVQPACSNSKSVRVIFNYRLARAGTQPVLSNVQAIVVGQAGVGVPPPSCRTQLQEIDSSMGRVEVTCSGNFTALNAPRIDVTASLTASCGMRPLMGRRRLMQSSPDIDVTATFNSKDSSKRVDTDSSVVSEGLAAAAGTDAVLVAGTVRASSVATAAAAAVTATARARQPLACCVTDAAAYGMQERPRSICFKHERPGTLAGRMNEGFYMQGEVANGKMQVVPQNMRRITDAADCKGGVTVGEVSSRCTSRTTMQLTVRARKIDIVKQQMFYFSCNRLGPSTVGDNWVSPGPPTGDDGEFRVTFFNLETPQGCTCRDTFWAVYEFGTFRGLPLDSCR